MRQRTDSDLRGYCRACAGWFPVSGLHTQSGWICPLCGEDASKQRHRAWARLGPPSRAEEPRGTAQPDLVRRYCDSDRFLG